MKKFSQLLFLFAIFIIFYLLHLPMIIECIEPSAKNTSPQKEWGSEQNGCRMSIEVEKKDFFRGYEPINVTVHIENVGKVPLLIIDENIFTDNEFTVKDEKGEVTTLTEFGKALEKPKKNLELKTFSIEPGKEISYVVLLNRVHDMTLRGAYSVILKRKVIKNGEDGKPIKKDGKYQEILMTSNTITIKVR